MAEKNNLTLLILSIRLCCGCMAQWYEAALLAMEEVGVQAQILAVQLAVFFRFI